MADGAVRDGLCLGSAVVQVGYLLRHFLRQLPAQELGKQGVILVDWEIGRLGNW